MFYQLDAKRFMSRVVSTVGNVANICRIRLNFNGMKLMWYQTWYILHISYGFTAYISTSLRQWQQHSRKNMIWFHWIWNDFHWQCNYFIHILLVKSSLTICNKKPKVLLVFNSFLLAMTSSWSTWCKWNLCNKITSEGSLYFALGHSFFYYYTICLVWVFMEFWSFHL